MVKTIPYVRTGSRFNNVGPGRVSAIRKAAKHIYFVYRAEFNSC